jgi:DeoR family transcriptional regulator, fructose operon transcriptional repressor
MLKEERHNYILREVSLRNRVQLMDIAQKLDVSEDTIRRDLKQLDEEGKVKKVHGGAISHSFHLYSYREEEIYAHASKSVIARKVQTMLKDGQTILMTGGTTNLEVARNLPEHFRATIFTPSLPVAMQLTERENVEVVFIGGTLSHDAQIALGGEAVSKILQIKADLCLLGTGYLDPGFGLSEFDWEVVQLKKAMVQSSKRIVSLTISEKINSTQRYQVCPIQSIHALVTELPPGSDQLKSFGGQSIEIL